jgi:hypothetical protein
MRTWEEPVEFEFHEGGVLAALEVNRAHNCVCWLPLIRASTKEATRPFSVLTSIPTLKALRVDGLPGEDGGVHTGPSRVTIPGLFWVSIHSWSLALPGSQFGRVTHERSWPTSCHAGSFA